jgi:hypothetical protein
MTTSLGFRADLMPLALQGSTAEERDGYIMERGRPAHLAIRLYRSLGFTDAEVQVQLSGLGRRR